ncbi:MAG: NAD(P)-binding protein [Polyangiaceae bacterium]|nr:NAD(P)-binding protein [Polyangiaceae bacterium]
MDTVGTLIVGAGVTGLATSAALVAQGDQDFLVLERDAEIGGYCKTVVQDGFTWDYSGHFFHFRDPAIERWLRERMPGRRVVTVQKRSFIRWADGYVDFPFQKNIHQLPREDFVDCLVDLYLARAPRELLGDRGSPRREERTFLDMLHARFGRGIAERFLVPYNEKLYACDLATLDVDAMGRFFPHADLTEIVLNMRSASNATYNATFTYPEGGAIEYVRALARDLPDGALATSEELVGLDLEQRIATTNRRELAYRRLISSAPFPALARLSGLPHDTSPFVHNRVLVFNLGFDTKGPREPHWIYYPDRTISFYRVGFYDNILGTERMSLYVELGYRHDQPIDVAEALPRVLADLERVGVVNGQRLVAWHSVVMDPAYVHVSQAANRERDRLQAELARHHVHSIGRYGGWTYCSIEDDIVEARALVASLAPPA